MTTPEAMFIYTAYPDKGEPFVVYVTMRHVLKWERSSPKGRPQRKASDLQDITADAAYELAYLAASAAGQYRGTQSDFEESVDLAGGDRLNPTPDDDTEGDELADPTQSAA